MIPKNDFVTNFKNVYSEFVNINGDIIYNMYIKVYCLYSLIQGDVIDCKKEQISFMITAHYLVINGHLGEAANQGGSVSPNGVVSSASIDGVSVSYQSKPITDFYQDFFSTSKYGLEFLAYLNILGSATYIN